MRLCRWRGFCAESVEAEMAVAIRGTLVFF